MCVSVCCQEIFPWLVRLNSITNRVILNFFATFELFFRNIIAFVSNSILLFFITLFNWYLATITVRDGRNCCISNIMYCVKAYVIYRLYTDYIQPIYSLCYMQIKSISQDNLIVISGARTLLWKKKYHFMNRLFELEGCQQALWATGYICNSKCLLILIKLHIVLPKLKVFFFFFLHTHNMTRSPTVFTHISIRALVLV